VEYIYVLPIGDIAEGILEFVSKKAMTRFDYPTKTLPEIAIPEHTFDAQRAQYSSTQILSTVMEVTPEDAVKVIGITEVDLCLPILTFVFGEAQLKGRAAVVSLHRLRQEYYGLPTDNDILLNRLGKEMVHELGHSFGLVHCWDMQCAMSFSGSVRKVDTKQDVFCDTCSGILSGKS
jgi:archaemetzincin